MTDREPLSATAPLPVRATGPVAAHPDPHHEGNGSLMSALLTRPPLHHLPAPDPDDRGRAWVARLFAGEFGFPAVPLAPLPPDGRPAAEYDALARAAGCRDLFVLHADTVAGERAIVDLARAAADRVLILSPNPTAADRVTERLLGCGVPVVRALADDENPVRPSPVVSRVTSAALGAARAEQARREAAAALAAAEKRIGAFAVVSKAVARLNEVNELLARLDADAADHAARRDRVEAEVRAETDTSFAASVARLTAEHAAESARHAAELQSADAAHADRTAALTRAKELHAELSRKPGLLGRIFGGKPKPGTPDPAEVEKQVHALEAEVAGLAARAAELRAGTATAAAGRAAAVESAVAAEIAARRAVCETALAATESDRARAEAAALNKAITAAVPGDDHAAAARALAEARVRADEQTRAAGDAFARAATDARVVVGTPGCAGFDPVFGVLADDPPFGALVLDRAEELPESEFPRLARFAERWVLVGDALPHDEPRPVTNGRAPRAGRAIEVSFVARLARALDRETWAAEGDRLVCRLVPLTPDQRRTATREPLADRPEIELRFVAADADEPLLAEIAFPGATPVPDAKCFLFHELNEVLLRPCGAPVWAHAPDALTASWPAADTDRAAVWIDLEPGVREKVAGTGPFAYTAAVSFDPAAGWDADRAAEWLGKHLPPPATGRFAALPRSTGPRPG